MLDSPPLPQRILTDPAAAAAGATAEAQLAEPPTPPPDAEMEVVGGDNGGGDGGADVAAAAALDDALMEAASTAAAEGEGGWGAGLDLPGPDSTLLPHAGGQLRRPHSGSLRQYQLQRGQGMYPSRGVAANAGDHGGVVVKVEPMPEGTPGWVEQQQQMGPALRAAARPPLPPRRGLKRPAEGQGAPQAQLPLSLRQTQRPEPSTGGVGDGPGTASAAQGGSDSRAGETGGNGNGGPPRNGCGGGGASGGGNGPMGRAPSLSAAALAAGGRMDSLEVLLAAMAAVGSLVGGL